MILCIILNKDTSTKTHRPLPCTSLSQIYQCQAVIQSTHIMKKGMTLADRYAHSRYLTPNAAI